jgi:hypothetical protein
MPRVAPTDQPARWRIQSTAVRARDGPERLHAVYRLLLTPGRSVPEHAAAGECQEATDASCDLCPRID